MDNSISLISLNRKAKYDYFVLESFEAGIELFGTEVKSIRQGNINLKDSWCGINSKLEIFVNEMHISPYEYGNIFNRDPLRVRKLLMHKKQILYLNDKVKRESLTIIPISVYFKNSFVKVQLGLCKGKKKYDKREIEAKRDADKSIRRTLKERIK